MIEVMAKNIYKKWRLKSGKCTHAFAREANVFPESYIRMERGPADRIFFSTLVKIRRALGISWEEFGKSIEEHTGE